MGHKTAKAISTIYTLVGCLMLLGADQLFFAILSVVCFLGAAGYSDVAQRKEKETILSNQWYESEQYPDF